MKFSKKHFYFIIFFCLLVLLSGCGKDYAKMEGYLLEVSSDNLVFVENISADKYDELKGLSMSEYINEGLSLYVVKTNKDFQVKSGDKVEILFDGVILESYPMQVTADKINILE